MSGASGEHYFAKIPGETGTAAFKHKPQRKKNQPKTEGQERTNQIYKAAIEQAKREYRDPVLRAAWEAEYKQWISNRKKNGQYYFHDGQQHLPRLWDYVRTKVLEREYKRREEGGQISSLCEAGDGSYAASGKKLETT